MPIPRSRRTRCAGPIALVAAMPKCVAPFAEDVPRRLRRRVPRTLRASSGNRCKLANALAAGPCVRLGLNLNLNLNRDSHVAGSQTPAPIGIQP